MIPQGSAITSAPAAHPVSRWRVPWHPVAVPVAFILTVWTTASAQPVWLIRPLVATLATVFLLTLALSHLLGDRDRGAVASAAIAVAVVVDDLRLSALLAAFAGLIVVQGLLSRGRAWRLGPHITRALSILAAALLAVSVFSAGTAGQLTAAVDDFRLDLKRSRPSSAADPSAPDIYVILLDGYPGDDAASLAPGFDPNAFPRALQARHFDVQRHSRTNYLVTRLVLASMLNGRHINDMPELTPQGLASIDARAISRRIDDAALLRLLHEHGYEQLVVASGWSHIGPRRVDRLVEPPQLNEFEVVLLRVSGIGNILAGLTPDLLSDQARARLDATMRAATSIAGERHDRPRLVFIHVPSPHPPAVFTSDGRPVNGSPQSDVGTIDVRAMSRDARIERTFEFSTYVGTRTVELVDGILAGEDEAPVIVILSDHGPGIDFDVQDPLGSDLDDRTSNFLAILSPGRPALFPPGTTPINVFPRVLNGYLGTSLPLQPDTVWAWRTGASVLDLVPVDTGSLAGHDPHVTTGAGP
jgi:hypothetical protein